MADFGRYDHPGVMSLGECQAALIAARKENAELKDGFLRMAAALDNTRKNGERDVTARVNQQIKRVAGELLEVADNLERALEHAEESNTLRPGVEATLRQLRSALEREGVSVMPVAPGVAFDPHQHEAISGVPADVVHETVLKVLQTGYNFGEQVLRPARVIVAVPRENM